MDLSKAFDTLNHGFSHDSLRLLYSYLSNRWQRTKINNTFSSWSEILLGVPQGSILGPLLFNIYLNDLFFINIESDLCNFADDNTLHLCDLSLDALVHKLEASVKSVIKWFDYNYMKLIESKCKLLISGNKEEVIIATVGSAKIIESREVTLLGCHIDRELKLNDHVSNKYKTAGKKLNALIRLCNTLPFHKKRLLTKVFIESQFAYCPLVGLFHSRALNTKINPLHHLALKFVHQDELSTFQELLIKDDSVSVHHRNIQFLAIELFKVMSGNAPFLVNEIFTRRVIPENSVVANLRSQLIFIITIILSVRFGTETLRALGPKILKILFLLQYSSVKLKWVPVNCPCRLCLNYVEGVGFI